MAALKKITVHGLQVEIWETSFRIEGMSEVVQVGPNLTATKVEQLIESIYRPVFMKAYRDGIAEVAHKAHTLVTELLS